MINVRQRSKYRVEENLEIARRIVKRTAGTWSTRAYRSTNRHPEKKQSGNSSEEFDGIGDPGAAFDLGTWGGRGWQRNLREEQWGCQKQTFSFFLA